MLVRQPQFDFSNTIPRWAENGEYAQMQNATSLIIPYLERFLNKVMAKARKEITGDDEGSQRIRKDIMTFIKQESCHYATHDAFNDVIRRAGYPGIPEFEKEIAAHYEFLLENKSLAFLTAYCEGFETLGPPAAQVTCSDRNDDVLLGADPKVKMLWRWHTMEEYEHRHVCHEVFHRIHGGYFLRIYAFFYQARFMFSMSGRIAKHLLDVDRASMTDAERKASVEREKIAKRAAMRMLGGIWKVFLPSYHPLTIAEPRQLKQVASEIDREWMPDKVAIAE